MFRSLVVDLTAGWIAAAGLPCGAMAQQQAPPSAERIREIQSKLFDLNYTIWVDGNEWSFPAELVDEELGYCKDNLDAKACALNTVLGMNFADQQCVAVSHGEWTDAGGSHATTHAAKRNDIKAASDNAMETCGKEAGADNCKIVAAVCSDGSARIGELERKR